MSGSVLVKSGAVVLVEESLVSSEVGHCIVIQVRARVQYSHCNWLGVRARLGEG